MRILLESKTKALSLDQDLRFDNGFLEITEPEKAIRALSHTHRGIHFTVADWDVNPQEHPDVVAAMNLKLEGALSKGYIPEASEGVPMQATVASTDTARPNDLTAIEGQPEEPSDERPDITWDRPTMEHYAAEKLGIENVDTDAFQSKGELLSAITARLEIVDLQKAGLGRAIEEENEVTAKLEQTTVPMGEVTDDGTDT